MTVNLLLSVSIVALLNSASIESIVLRSGDRVAVQGRVAVEGNQALFRDSMGTLYSIAIHEIDSAATEKAASATEARRQLDRSARPGRAFSVSDEEKDRLLRAIEANHEGKPAPPRLPPAPSVTGPSEELTVSERNDERYWRERARSYEEALRRRKEDLQLLLDRKQKLEDEILSLLSYGYSSNQVGYQALQLQDTRDSLPAARLEVIRATREWDQFRDDARREGILPGWLR